MTNKKNTFSIKSIKRTNTFKNMIYGHKIIWIDDLKKDSQLFDGCLDMDEYFSNMNNIGLLKTDNYKNLILIGVCELHKGIKLYAENDEKQYMYLISDNDFKELYMSIEKCHPIFWYKFNNKKDFYSSFDSLYITYNPPEYYNSFKSNIRGFIGTERMLNATIDNIENFLSFNNFTEFLMWGSCWDDHPFREEYIEKIVPTRACVVFTRQGMKQKHNGTYTISVRSKYSKSIITIENHEGAYIINIKYNPITTKQIININKEFGKEFKDDIPIDIIMTITELPFVTHTGLLLLENISNNNFSMASLVANSKDMYIEMLDIINDLINKSDKNNDDYVDMLNSFKKNININIKMYEIFTDKKITAFIDNKIDSYKNNKQTEDEIKDEIEKILSDKLLNTDQSFKEYLLNMIKNIIC